MITFKFIRWKNFLSTGNYFNEISLNSSKSTLIIGKNGSGKSCITDAICYVLFNKPFRNINKSQLINSINLKGCEVQCEFEVDSKSYTIIRGMKPNKFEIFCDGKLINQDATIKDYQEFLEKCILKMNYKSFTQIVVLGSASYTPFMELTASDRRAVIEDLLDIQIFTSMNALVKSKLSNNKENITTTKHQIELYTQKIQLLENHLNELKRNNEEEIEHCQKEIESHQLQLNNILQENTDIILKIDELSQSLSNKEELEHTLKQCTKIETQLEQKLHSINENINFFEKYDECPTCKQSIDLNFKIEQIDTLSKKNNELSQGIERLQLKITDFNESINHIKNIQKQIQSHQLKLATNNTSISQISIFIKRITEQITSLSNDSKKSFTSGGDLTELYNKLEQSGTQLKNYTEEKFHLEFALELLKDTGIKTRIIKQYLPVINKFVNNYLSSLDFYVNFTLDETFKEKIVSRNRDDFSYNSFSEGEKQRISMALMLTWRAIAKMKNSTNTNLLILDETFDSSLDGSGTEYLMNILRTLENVYFFVISHKGDALQDKFINVIKFDKVKNFSKIVSG